MIKKRGGGIAIYIHKDIHNEYLNDLTFNTIDYLEILTTDISLPKSTNIILSYIYNSPNNNTFNFINTIYNKFHNYINNKLIIVGNFNINTANNTNLKLNMKQPGLSPLINNNTRPTHTTAQLIIDQFYTNISDKIQGSSIILEDITDHLPIYVIIQNNK